MRTSDTIPDADFSFIRYANCWEDPQLLIDSLRPETGRQILSIASAGDNALSLIAGGARVIATDLNPAQIACVELRREAIRLLDYSQFIAFCGIEPSKNRLDIYNSIRSSLSVNSRTFWDKSKNAVKTGFIHSGKFERYFCIFRKYILPIAHTKREILTLIQKKSREERIAYYNGKWNNRRWRLLFKVFFCRRVMGRFGRDPQFFNEVNVDVASSIIKRVHYALTELDTSTNPYLEYILTGNFSHSKPHYLIPENYSEIRRNISNLVIDNGAIDDVAEKYGVDSFDGYNLSDIFEYVTPEQSEALYARLIKSARPGARLAYWNMLVPRKCPEGSADQMKSLRSTAKTLFLKDKAFFYSDFRLEEVQ